MSDRLARRAGNALVWQGAEMAGVKLVFLLRMVVLARILGPDEFGLFAISIIAINFLMSISNPGMLPALVQKTDPRGVHYDAAWTVVMGRGLVVALIAALGAPLISDLFAEPRATDLLRALAIRPLLHGAASMRVAGLVRELRFRSLALLNLSESLANAVVSIALAAPFGVWALVAGPLAGSAARTMLSYMLAPYRPRLRIDRVVLDPLLSFGRWIWLYGLLAVGGNLALRLVVSRQLGTVELGLYFLAAGIGFLPSEAAGKAVGDVAFPVYARVQHDLDRARRAFRSVLAGIAVLVVPAAALLMLLAPDLVAHVLGSKWEGTIPIIRILAVVTILGLLGDAVAPFLKGSGRPDRMVALLAVQTGALVILLWPMTAALGLVGAALAWVPAVIIAQLVALRYLRAALSRPLAGLVTRFLAIALSTGASLGTAKLTVAAIQGMPGLILAVGVAMAVYGAVLWWLDGRLELGLATDAARVFPGVDLICARFGRWGGARTRW